MTPRRGALLLLVVLGAFEAAALGAYEPDGSPGERTAAARRAALASLAGSHEGKSPEACAADLAAASPGTRRAATEALAALSGNAAQP